MHDDSLFITKIFISFINESFKIFRLNKYLIILNTYLIIQFKDANFFTNYKLLNIYLKANKIKKLLSYRKNKCCTNDYTYVILPWQKLHAYSTKLIYIYIFIF